MLFLQAYILETKNEQLTDLLLFFYYFSSLCFNKSFKTMLGVGKEKFRQSKSTGNTLKHTKNYSHYKCEN